MEGFRIDLKRFLGLAMPNQYSLTVRKQISSWFWGNNWGQNPLTFMIPIYSTTIPYDINIYQHQLLCRLREISRLLMTKPRASYQTTPMVLSNPIHFTKNFTKHSSLLSILKN